MGTTWRDAFIRNVHGLHGLEVDIVLGNHPNQSNTLQKMEQLGAGGNPFVDTQEWERMLDKCEKNYRRLQENDPIL